jgi:hypothetical protein
LKKRSERKSNVTVNGLFISIILVFVSNAVAKIIVSNKIAISIKTQNAIFSLETKLIITRKGAIGALKIEYIH